jgi:hypothetical protein
LAAGFFGYGGQTVDGGCYGADFDLSIVFCKTIKTKVSTRVLALIMVCFKEACDPAP